MEDKTSPLLLLRRPIGHRLEDEEIRKLHSDIIAAAAEEVSTNAGSWSSLLRVDKTHSRRRLMIACAIQAFQQRGAINAIICKLELIFSPEFPRYNPHILLKHSILRCWL